MTKGTVNNVFEQLDDELSLWLLGLCLASNDLATYEELLTNDRRPEEKTFYFMVMLSIVREVAKIVGNIEKSELARAFSEQTRCVFEGLNEKLGSFEDDSLAKGTLKPVRDFVFHYDFTESSVQDKKRALASLAGLRSESRLGVRLRCDMSGVLGNRYTFADGFRSGLVWSYIQKHDATELSAITAAVLDFTDSLLSDLANADN